MLALNTDFYFKGKVCHQEGQWFLFLLVLFSDGTRTHIKQNVDWICMPYSFFKRKHWRAFTSNINHEEENSR